MQIRCPNCQGQMTHRSRPRGIVESVLLAAILVRPFRCEVCDSRFLRWSLKEKAGPRRPATTS